MTHKKDITEFCSVSIAIHAFVGNISHHEVEKNKERAGAGGPGSGGGEGRKN